MQRFSIPGQGGHLSGLNFSRSEGPIDVTFLHATGFSASTYRQLLEPLGPDLRVVAFDLRGHGHTSLPTHPKRLVNWYQYADDVIHALTQLGDGKPSTRLIAGHSLGGTVALLAQARHPSLAKGLLMIDPAMILPRLRRWLMMPFGPRLLQRRLPIARGAARRRASFPNLHEVLASYSKRDAFRSWLPGFLDDYINDAFAQRADGSVTLRCDPAWESATFCAHRHDLAHALKQLRAPARMMVAERQSTSARILPFLNDWAPSVQVEQVVGSSHFIPMEQPELVRSHMLQML
jgi:pimeloyl-ACP methyl ester carboxylesterase